jgi:dTDP-4-dehydrorhamnose reductase
MKILITGKDGQLGKSFYEIISKTKPRHTFIFTGKRELDLSNKNIINEFFIKNNFDVIINCAAYTDVEKAEIEPNMANKINHIAVKQLAKISNKQKIKLIHISTDYVFDGNSLKPYEEPDEAHPINVYGKTKLAGEKAIQSFMKANAIIIRSSWIYSEYGNNFVKTMLSACNKKNDLNVVSDQIGSPTYASDLANCILTIVNHSNFDRINRNTCVYHYSNQGECSWSEFAIKIFNLAKIECSVKSITTDEYPSKIKRPKYTVMNKDKIIKEFGVNIPLWADSLDTCVNSINKQ